MPAIPVEFLGLEQAGAHGDRAADKAARVAVLPLPFERTTSYGKGTSEGPAALLAASMQVELYDEELQCEPFENLQLETLAPFHAEAFDLETALAEIQDEAERHVRAGKLLISLGGEHSLTLATARAVAAVLGPPEQLGVVQFDAHADLRDSYEGTPFSHACVLRRLLDDGHPTAAVGIRALSAAEGELIRERSLPTLWGHELTRLPQAELEARFDAMLDGLPPRVYLTFDVDYFDPPLMAATGTPVPGGGTWWPTLTLLRRLFERKQVVAFDVVELAPRAGLHACDFLAAQLTAKCLAYWLQARHP